MMTPVGHLKRSIAYISSGVILRKCWLNSEDVEYDKTGKYTDYIGHSFDCFRDRLGSCDSADRRSVVGDDFSFHG